MTRQNPTGHAERQSLPPPSIPEGTTTPEPAQELTGGVVMRDLLERWARVCPDECFVSPVTELVQVKCWASNPLMETWPVHPAGYSPSDRGVLLTAVIEAIEARAKEAREHNATVDADDADGDYKRLWSWRLAGRAYGTHGAHVWTGYPGTVGLEYDNDNDDSPAAALLSAYLTAVEAQ